jgi:hypothetical protein
MDSAQAFVLCAAAAVSAMCLVVQAAVAWRVLRAESTELFAGDGVLLAPIPCTSTIS